MISFFVLCFNFSKRVASPIYVSFYLLYPFSIKGTRLKHDEIAEYVGDKNSNLDVSDIYRISKESLDMMIADKKAEEKLAIFAQYRQEVFIYWDK
jgi:hypothetical protein